MQSQFNTDNNDVPEVAKKLYNKDRVEIEPLGNHMDCAMNLQQSYRGRRPMSVRWRKLLAIGLLGALSVGIQRTDRVWLEAQELQIIFEARQAISERRYGDVSRLLLDYLETTNESSQLIDQLIAEITNDIQIHNSNLDLLIAQLQVQPENVARIDELIASLEQLAREFNIDIDAQVLLVRKVAVEAREQKMLDELLVRVADSLARGNYAMAGARINEASRVGRERIAVGIDSTLEQQRLTQSIVGATAALREIVERSLPTVASLSNTVAISGGSQRRLAVAAGNNLLTAHQQMDEQRQRLLNDSQIIQQIADDNPDSYYASLMTQLFPVRDEAAGTAPIEVVANIVADLNTEIAQRFERTIYDALNDFGRRLATLTITDTDSAIRSATEYAELYLDLIAYPTSDPDISAAGNAITVATIDTLTQPDDMRGAIMLSQALGTAQLTEMIGGFQATVLSSAVTVDDSDGVVGSLSDDRLTRVLQQFQTNWLSTAQSIEQSVAQAAFNDTVVDDVATSLSTISQLFDDVLSTSQAAQITTVEGLLRDIIAQYRSDIATGNELLGDARQFVSATTAVTTQNNTEIAKAYPQRAIDSIDQQLPTYEDALAEIEIIYVALPSTDQQTIYANQDEFREFFSQYLTMVEALQGLRELANAQIAQATVLELEGDNLANSSQNAIEQDDGVLARSLWEQASASYLASLALNENDAVRAKIERRGSIIQQNIVDLEYQRVIRQVRTLLVDSRRAVALQDIDRAYQLLLEAAELWALTNTEPNQEVEQQLEFIQLVLTFEEQYNIDEDDSLYPVVSGYLNGAAENLTVLAAGTLGATEFDAIAIETDRIISNILNIQPYNTEARTLNLRLLRETNTDEFNIILEELYDSAVNSSQSALQERLSTLYSIQNIDANYRDIDAVIASLEIEIGIRQAPVPSASIDASIELVARANDLIATGDATRIDAGRELILEALEVNPDNIEAQQVLDSLRLSGEAEVTYSLNSEDAQLLNRAETLFLQGNVAQTFVILENLWQNTENRSYPPLANLRRQVTTRLGI